MDRLLMYMGWKFRIEYYKKFENIELPVEEVESCIGEAFEGHYEILLAHNPVFAKTYLKWGADLILSGHLHGGIVRVPKLGGVITPQARYFRNIQAN